MTLTLVVRDALEVLEPQVTGVQDVRSSASLETFVFYLESSLQARFQYIFGGGWLRQIVELPIIAPEVAQARSWTLPGAVGNIQVAITGNATRPPAGPAFRAGLTNALFLGLPFTFSHLIAFRRYTINGLPAGLGATVGYRIGEVVALQRIATGGAFRWAFYSLEPLPRIAGLFLTCWVLWDGTGRRVKYRGSTTPLSAIVGIFAIHFAYAWVEQGIFRSVVGTQTLDVATDVARLYVGPGSWRSATSYSLGLLLGSLLRDVLFINVGRFLAERWLRFLNVKVVDWRRILNKWTNYIAAGVAFATIPFYTLDYRVRNPLGFQGKDDDLSRALTKLVYSTPAVQGDNNLLSLMFEARYSITPDSYNRPGPDALREPWIASDAAIEISNDPVDDAYAVRTAGQRLDVSYLNSSERGLLDWVLRRRGALEVKEAGNQPNIPVNVPPRFLLGADVAPATPYISAHTEFRASRFYQWYRTITGAEPPVDYNLPVRFNTNPPDGLSALWYTAGDHQKFFAGQGPNEPTRRTRYDTSVELFRKKNARRSPLHRGPVHIYRDWLLSRQPREYLNTALQQRELYRARLVLGDYITASRRYCEPERTRRGWNVKQRTALMGVWHREFANRFRGGVRSRASTVYSQQYSGNIHRSRRLFAVSWDPRENRRINANTTAKKAIDKLNKRTVKRRKLALDNITRERRTSTFEHEELGRAEVPKLKTGENRLRANLSPSARALLPARIDAAQWVLLPGAVAHADRNVHPQPLYAGWDNERRAFILCNRYLPPEQAVRGGPSLPAKPTGLSTVAAQDLASRARTKNLQSREAGRARFSVWPRNSKTRRLRAANTRYPKRRIQSRRRPVRDVALLSRDRARWAHSRHGTHVTTGLAFWLNPRSEQSRAPKELHPSRSSAALPVSFERSTRVTVYAPGDIKPSARGGLIWPGGDRLKVSTPYYWRPGHPVDLPANAL
jgi:hypothetical protein